MDDAHDLSPAVRFAVQIAAALVMIFGGGVVLTDLGRMTPSGELLELGWLAVPFTVFATLGVINALNMCDGVDGLSGSLAMISLTGLMIVSAVGGGPADTIVLAVMATAIIAFLFFNMRLPGRSSRCDFHGRCGQHVSGLRAHLVHRFPVPGGAACNGLPAAAHLWFLMLPLFDTMSMMLRRLAKRRSPFSADREHIHHVFLMAGFTVNETVIIMSAAALIGVGIGLLCLDIRLPEFSIAGFFIVCGILYFWMMLRSWKVMRFIERSICRRNATADRRAGADRRLVADSNYAGPERRQGRDRRIASRRRADRGEDLPGEEPGEALAPGVVRQSTEAGGK